MYRSRMMVATLVAVIVAGCASSTASPSPSGTVGSSESAAAASTTTPAGSAAASTTAPAGSASAGVPTETVTLKVAGYSLAEDSQRKLWDQTVQAFEAANPDIKIESIPVPFFESLDQYLTMVASGNAPDMAQVSIENVQLFKTGAVIPLEDKLPADLFADLPDAPRDATTIDGHLLAWPWATGTIQLLYNPKILADAGITAPAKTLDELKQQTITVAQKLGPEVLGLGETVKRGAFTAYFWMPFLWSFGGDVFSEDGKTITINSDAAVQAVSYYRDLVKADGIPTGQDVFDFRGLFAQDKLAYYADCSCASGLLKAASPQGADFKNFAGMPAPAGPAGPSSLLWGHWWTIFKTSDHQAESVRFLQFLVSDPDVAKLWFEGQSQLPASKKLLAGAPYADDPFAKAYIDGLADARSITKAFQYNPAFLQALDAISIAIEDVALTDRDPKEALDQAAQSLTVLYPGTTVQP